mmetsp:Transcript_93626/g.214140  ORF Transcript_93626/g.214140 Transcript_93626/m.214140 type:complete len:331 (+) Transcript_93626:71-1063(+)
MWVEDQDRTRVVSEADLDQYRKEHAAKEFNLSPSNSAKESTVQQAEGVSFGSGGRPLATPIRARGSIAALMKRVKGKESGRGENKDGIKRLEQEHLHMPAFSVAAEDGNISVQCWRVKDQENHHMPIQRFRSNPSILENQTQHKHHNVKKKSHQPQKECCFPDNTDTSHQHLFVPWQIIPDETKNEQEGYGSVQIPIYVTSGELKQEPVVCTPTNNDASSQTKRKNEHFPLTEQQFSPHAPGTSRIQGNHQRHPTGQVQIGSPSRRTNGHRVLRGAVAKDHDSKASSCDKSKHLGAVIAASDEYPWPGHMPWQQKNMLSRQQMVLEALDS